MASIRKRSHRGANGEVRWVADFFDQARRRYLRTFTTQRAAQEWLYGPAGTAARSASLRRGRTHTGTALWRVEYRDRTDTWRWRNFYGRREAQRWMFDPAGLAAAIANPKLAAAPARDAAPPPEIGELAGELRILLSPLLKEHAVSGKERREGNAKLDLLLRKVALLEHQHGVLEKPVPPRHTRRRPLGDER
jgi:hypothetical protein